MHVSLVCPYSLDAPGGVATHVLGLARWLAGRGHRATVIAPGTRQPPGVDGVDVHLLGQARDFRFNGSVAQLAVGAQQSADAVRVATRADVVHVHEPLTPGAAYAVARAAGPLVVTHHASFAVHRAMTAILRRRSRVLGERRSIAVSRAAAVTARQAGGVDPLIIGNGILLPEAPDTKAGWRGGERPRIGFLGRLDEPRKGFTVFRRLAQLATTRGIAAEFVALGPGSVDPGPVRLLGAVDDDTRDKMLQDVDILVAPNLFGESFGLVLVEALASGCDVVASDLPGFRDVLHTAGVGALFPAGDSETALTMLCGRLRHPSDPRQLHAAAHHWGWDTLGPRIIQEYEAILAVPDSALGQAAPGR